MEQKRDRSVTRVQGADEIFFESDHSQSKTSGSNMSLQIDPELLQNAILMSVRNMVDAGRVAYINHGEYFGKMVIIVDMVNIKTVRVDGLDYRPTVLYPLKKLQLTELRVPGVSRGCKSGPLKKAAAAYQLKEQWAVLYGTIKMKNDQSYQIWKI